MAGNRIRFSFHSRVLLLVLTMSWLLVGTFMVFQYRREKAFKEQLLDCELQMHNRRILDDIARGMPVDSIIDHIGSPLDNLRISLIDNDGNVIFDNNDSTPSRRAITTAVLKLSRPASRESDIRCHAIRSATTAVTSTRRCGATTASSYARPLPTPILFRKCLKPTAPSCG